MIGYVKPALKRLPRNMRTEYRAVYCGLCHALKRAGGPVGVACLNYEATTVLLLAMALQEEEPVVLRGTCSYAPLVLVPYMDYRVPALETAACVSVSVARMEVRDNLWDEGGFRWKVASHLLRRSADRAEAALGETFFAMQEAVERYYLLEEDKNASFDGLMDAGGRLFEAMSAPILDAACAPCREMLSDITRALGRWTLLMDACDDWQADRKNGAFNLLGLLPGPGAVREAVEDTERTLEELSAALPVRRYGELARDLLTVNLRRVSTGLLEKLERGWVTDGRPV